MGGCRGGGEEEREGRGLWILEGFWRKVLGFALENANLILACKKLRPSLLLGTQG